MITYNLDNDICLFQLFFQKLPCIACSAGSNFFRGTHCYDISAFISTFRSEIDYIIGTFDDVHVMLDDNDAVSPANQCVESIQQSPDLNKMRV